MGRLNEVVLTGIVDEEKRELVKVSANGLAANIPLVQSNPLTGGSRTSSRERPRFRSPRSQATYSPGYLAAK